MADEFKKSDLQILVSTMNRNSLDFLIQMFPFANFSDYNILVVNQTDENATLISDIPNIKVINSFTKGLSKSRNIALNESSKKILLIADDDVVYFNDFDEKIIASFNNNFKASVICFQTKTKENQSYSRYKPKEFWMKIKDLVWVLSIEIAFKREDIFTQKIQFNEHFGLGAQFQDSESLFFLRRILFSKLKILFYPKDIVIHKKYSSSDDVTSDQWLYAKSASFYKRFQSFSYLFLFKLLFFLFRKKFISFNEISSKLKIGYRGIQDYKLLLKNKTEHYYD